MAIEQDDEYTRKRELLQIEIDKQEKIIRGLYLEMGLEQSLKQSFWWLELEYDDLACNLLAAEAVSEEQHRILETFGFPINGYTLIRRLTVEHERRMMANARHPGAKERIQRVRQEWKNQGAGYPSKTKFAEEIASREGVDFKTVYGRWLKGI